MELDKRIKTLTDIYSVNDGCHDWKFMNQKGYFANRITDFHDLSQCVYGTYDDYREQDKCFFCKVDLSKGTSYSDWFTYFIPEDALKPAEKKEPKYRPYTIKDFEKAFLNDEFEDFIIFRIKDKPDDVYTMRYNGNFKKDDFEYICLGAKNFSFQNLFDNYEVANYDGDWQPFGILEE